MASRDVVIKLVREDNEEFIIDNTEWLIPSNGLDGFGGVENSISTTDNAIGDGVIITSKRLSSADRTVKCIASDARYNRELRHRAISFFNVKKQYKLYITYMGLTRWCQGWLYKIQVSEGNIYQRVELQFTLMCPSPYLRSFDDFGKDIAGLLPMVAFPYLCNQETGRPTGIYAFGQDVVLSNDGDAETYANVVMIANGDVVNPKLIINGNYVRVIDNMKQGDKITMDFTVQPPTVKKNGVNYIGHCDRSSAFNAMQLNIGDNIISYEADEGDTFMTVSIYYNKLYCVI